MPPKPLRWSERALLENRHLLYYLLSEWGEEVAIRVDDQINKTADRIQQFPEQFPIFFKTKKIRRSVVTPQTSIFFKEFTDEIVILAIFDNRQSPRKLKL
jgi:plasmid stabilization system protein ParE